MEVAFLFLGGGLFFREKTGFSLAVCFRDAAKPQSFAGEDASKIKAFRLRKNQGVVSWWFSKSESRNESGQIKNPAKNHGVFLLPIFGASKKDLRKFRCVFKIPEKSVTFFSELRVKRSGGKLHQQLMPFVFEGSIYFWCFPAAAQSVSVSVLGTNRLDEPFWSSSKWRSMILRLFFFPPTACHFVFFW